MLNPTKVNSCQRRRAKAIRVYARILVTDGKHLLYALFLAKREKGRGGHCSQKKVPSRRVSM